VKIRPVRTISRKPPDLRYSSSIRAGSRDSSTAKVASRCQFTRNANARSTGGWQLHPVFHVYQHERYRAVLEALVSVFGCGGLRPKGPNSSVWSFAVDGLVAQEQHVVPFFECHPLVVKADDFRAYSAIVRSMRRKEHLDRDGFERLVRLAYGMNLAGKQRSRSMGEILAGSSETARQAPSTHAKSRR